MRQMDYDPQTGLGKIIKQQRISLSLTLMDLASKSGISASHLGRIERGERFPSAGVLKKIARPLEFREEELMALAGYLNPRPEEHGNTIAYRGGRLDPDIAKLLAQEPLAVQRATIGILAIVKNLGKRLGPDD